MFPVVRTFSRLAVPTLRCQHARCYGGVAKTMKERVDEACVSMDHLPSPAGDFQTEYSKRQTKYNINLLASLVCFSVAVAVAKQSGAIDYPWPDTTTPLNIYDGVAPAEVDEETLANEIKFEKAWEEYAKKN